MSKISERDIRCAAEIIRNCKNGVVLSGAGISTPSGIPDFRSTESGLWSQYDPFEVASLSAFRYHPERFFQWMQPLARGIHAAHPNPAHISVAQMEQMGFINTVITQNIDGLHQRAGSGRVLEVHGSFRTLTCTRCFHQVDSNGFLEPFLEHGVIPHCPGCGAVLKPDLVLFGEQLPSRTWLLAMEASRKCELMIVAGSSLEVLPVAGLPMRAVENGAHLIMVNQSETYIDVRADIVFYADVVEVLPLIAQAVLEG